MFVNYKLMAAKLLEKTCFFCVCSHLHFSHPVNKFAINCVKTQLRCHGKMCVDLMKYKIYDKL